MTDTETKPASNAPAYIAYAVRNAESGKSYWTRVGCAWPLNKVEGLSVQLEALPLDGRIVLRPASAKIDE